MILNGLGALATGVTLIVIVASKFTEGAWLSILLIGLLFVLYLRVSRYYRALRAQLRHEGPLGPPGAAIPVLCHEHLAEGAGGPGDDGR